MNNIKMRLNKLSCNVNQIHVATAETSDETI